MSAPICTVLPPGTAEWHDTAVFSIREPPDNNLYNYRISFFFFFSKIFTKSRRLQGVRLHRVNTMYIHTYLWLWINETSGYSFVLTSNDRFQLTERRRDVPGGQSADNAARVREVYGRRTRAAASITKNTQGCHRCV